MTNHLTPQQQQENQAIALAGKMAKFVAGATEGAITIAEEAAHKAGDANIVDSEQSN